MAALLKMLDEGPHALMLPRAVSKPFTKESRGEEPSVPRRSRLLPDHLTDPPLPILSKVVTPLWDEVDIANGSRLIVSDDDVVVANNPTAAQPPTPTLAPSVFGKLALLARDPSLDNRVALANTAIPISPARLNATSRSFNPQAQTWQPRTQQLPVPELPHWRWENAEAKQWLAYAMWYWTEDSYHSPTEAKDTLHSFKGNGSTLYNKRQTDWMVWLGEEAGRYIHEGIQEKRWCPVKWTEEGGVSDLLRYTAENYAASQESENGGTDQLRYSVATQNQGGVVVSFGPQTHRGNGEGSWKSRN